MRFQINADLRYQLSAKTSFIFALKCVETGGQWIVSEDFQVESIAIVGDFSSGEGMNRFTRVDLDVVGEVRVFYQAEMENAYELVEAGSLDRDDSPCLDPEAIPYLWPSRYCPSDRMRNFAADLFGSIEGPYSKARAISDWITAHVSYQSGSSTEQSSAMETFERRQGVCRDFAHLGVAFCRALNIPARYVSVYSHLLEPPDFHAVFEICIGGIWYLFDPTQLAPMNGFTRIAAGRDAADVSVATVFGNSALLESSVTVTSLGGDYEHVTMETLGVAGNAFVLI